MSVDSSDMDAEFQRGHAAHMSGDLEAAAASYEKILQQDPRHAPSLHGLGNVMLRRGHIDRAETFIREAIAADSTAAGYHNSLGNVLVGRGLFEQARAAYRAELNLRPDFAVAHHQLGVLALNEGRNEAAIECFQSALKFAPQFSVAANNLGRALNNVKRYEQAAEAFRHALRIDPGLAQAHANLGHVCRVTGEPAAARQHFERALKLDDRLGGAHRGLAQLALAEGKPALAVAALNEAIRVDPTDARALALLGGVYFGEGMIENAHSAYSRAIDLQPDDPDLLSDAAAVSRVVGQDDEALERYKAALALRSTHQEALSGYALLVSDRGDAKAAAARLAPSVNSGRAGPHLLSTYAAILGKLGRRREGITLLETALQKRQPPEVSMRLHFALAALLDGEGSYDLAFYHCRRANEERKSPFDPDSFARQIDAIIQSFDPRRPALPVSAWQAPGAVFVVGLPRSGVRILSRVLGRHEQIEALAPSAQVENSVLGLWRVAGVNWPAPLADVAENDSTRVAQQCLSGRLPTSCAATWFLDSTWRNYQFLGVIARLFPGVRIIECVRDARDIARSCYFADFATSKGLPFSYDLNHIAAYINGYRRLMDHWRQTPGLSIHQVSYERLVLDAAKECRSISEFLDLPYSPEAFGLIERPEEAGSWRLDAKALRRYRHYRAHLEGFVEALDAPPES
jgi:tetratricopeptide (TPR) repeat protein